MQSKINCMHQSALTAAFLAGLVLLTQPSKSSAQVFKTNLFDTQAEATSSVLVPSDGPVGQSFTAKTNAIGWASLFLDDANPSNGLSATLHVNLRNYTEASNGVVGGNVIASSYASMLTNGHKMSVNNGATRFVFPTNISLAVGAKYWLEIISDSGDEVRARYNHYFYSGGDVIAWGTNRGTIAPNANVSLWDMGFALGTIIKYPEFKNARVEPANTNTPNDLVFRSEAEGVVGQQFSVEISSNLVNWVPFITNTFMPLPTLIELPLTGQTGPPRQLLRLRYNNQQ